MMYTPVFSALEVGPILGAGCFGEVHSGQDPIHGHVAIKIFQRLSHETDVQWTSRRDDLIAEGQRLKDAEHDRIVRVFGISHDTIVDKLYLIMELCRGGSLEFSFEQGPSTLHFVRDIVTDVSLGLDAIHSRDLLHRDIKPGNILIDDSGRAKLGDFGLVTDRIVLGYGSARGYLDHLAKEVWSTGQTSIRSDIWALGMTTYRLLHGKEFYDALEVPRNSIPHGGYALSLPWLAHVPDGWRRFVRKCMNDDPHKRYQSAQDVLQALERVPIEPDWRCTYSPNHTIWRRTKKNRINEVEWIVHSPRRHEWNAMSQPSSSIGRRRTIASSNGIVSKRTAISGLEGFFASAI